MAGKKNLCAMLPEELFLRLKDHLVKTGLKQKEFMLSLIEEALREDA